MARYRLLLVAALVCVGLCCATAVVFDQDKVFFADYYGDKAAVAAGSGLPQITINGGSSSSSDDDSSSSSKSDSDDDGDDDSDG
eukprot:scaffold32160_cov48-Prasinocladus_malaysianus.AAC.1